MTLLPGSGFQCWHPFVFLPKLSIMLPFPVIFKLLLAIVLNTHIALPVLVYILTCGLLYILFIFVLKHVLLMKQKQINRQFY